MMETAIDHLLKQIYFVENICIKNLLESPL